MPKSKWANYIVIDWSQLKNINPNKPLNQFKVMDEVNAIERDVYGNNDSVHTLNIVNMDILTNYATKDIPAHYILDSMTEYKDVCNKLKISPKEFKKRFPMLHRMVWTSYLTLKKEYPELVENYEHPKAKIEPKKEFLSEEAERLSKIDVSQYELKDHELSGYNPKTDYYEHVYEVPRCENSSDIIAAIIDAERPIPEVGTVILTESGFKDGKEYVKHHKMTQKAVEDEIMVHLKWQRELEEAFTGDKLVFKITPSRVDVLEQEKEKVPPRRK